jgi:chromosomal replication initiation ATPase DnaA
MADGSPTFGSGVFKKPRSLIIREVAAKHGLDEETLLSSSQTKPICHARQEAMYELRRQRGDSYSQITRALGRTDHTTAVHGVRAHIRRTQAEGAKRPPLDIIEEVAELYGVSAAAIMGASKEDTVFRARNHAMYELRKQRGDSYTTISRVVCSSYAHWTAQNGIWCHIKRMKRAKHGAIPRGTSRSNSGQAGTSQAAAA